MEYQVLRFSPEHDEIEETFNNRQEAEAFMQELRDETPRGLLEIINWYIKEV